MHYKYMQFRMSTHTSHNVGFKNHPVTYDITQPHHHKFHLENVLNEISRPCNYDLGTPGNNAPYLLDALFPLHFSKQESTPMPEEDNKANDFVKHQLSERLADKYLEKPNSPILDKITDESSKQKDSKSILADTIHDLLNEHLKYAPIGRDLIKYTQDKSKYASDDNFKELYKSLAEFFSSLKDTK